MNYKRLHNSLLFRNTVSLLAGSGIRLLLQAAYFVLIARALGVEQYGAFIGVVALVAILAPYAPVGRGQILIRNVARDPTAFRESWGNALLMTGLCGSALTIAILILARFALSHGLPDLLVMLVALTDLLFAAVAGLAAQAFQAFEQLHRTAQVYVVLTGLRAASALGLLAFVHHVGAFTWGFFYFASSLIAAVYAVSAVSSKLGTPRFSLSALRSDFLEGFYFSVSLSSQSIYNDIDKTMLVRLSNFSAAGIYAVAYRVIDLSFQPIGALLWSAYPLYFRQGKQGLSGTMGLSKRLLPFAATYGLLIGGILFVSAPVLPLVLGSDFSAAVGALQWLSPLVLVKTLHYFPAQSLTGADFQGIRSGVQLLVAALNVLLNLWLIPAFSWRGAAWASLASDGALAIGIYGAVMLLRRRQITSIPVCGAEPTIIL